MNATIYVKDSPNTATKIEPVVSASNVTIADSAGNLSNVAAEIAQLRRRNITISSADPSGGNDGDIWIKYNA